MDSFEAREILARKRKDALGILRQLGSYSPIQPKRAQLFTRHTPTPPGERFHVGAPHAAVRTCCLIVQLSALAEIDDVLSRAAQEASGLAGRQKPLPTLHVERLGHNHKKRNASTFGCGDGLPSQHPRRWPI